MPSHTSTQVPGVVRRSHRQLGDSRGYSSFGANDDPAAGGVRTHAPLPNGQARKGGIMAGPQHFDPARSPPNAVKKNTKHVPCKFHRMHACQAGRACPFGHSNDGTIETALCKYFAKGNCKFGAKCALAHIPPNGQTGMAMNPGALNIGGRVNPPTYQHQDSALANSLLSQQQPPPTDPSPGQNPYAQEEAGFAQEYGMLYPPSSGGVGVGAHPGLKYGSPTNDSQLLTPGAERRITALDAPLPASFDSNGISHMALYGAVAASVPSKFGMESPPASLSPRLVGPHLDAVKTLRSSAFPSNLRTSYHLGSSPPVVNLEESISHRKMHSRPDAPRPGLLSASMPRAGVSHEWDEGFPLEEDYLPTTLHDDVLTPQEKMRRLSRPEQEFSGSKNATQGGLGIPSGSSSKVGSPLASSPSRFSALFAKQRQESNSTGTGMGMGTGFGHVGSPLRESHIRNASDTPFGDGVTARPSSGSRSRSALAGDQSPFSSPPRESGFNFGMNMISSQLQRTHLGAGARNDPTDAYASSRIQRPTAAGMRQVSAPSSVGGRFDRTISSPGINSTRIAEEKEGEGDLVFSMDDDNSRRNSSLWGSKSPVISPLSETRNGGGGGGGIGVPTERGKLSVNGGLENVYGNR